MWNVLPNNLIESIPSSRALAFPLPEPKALYWIPPLTNGAAVAKSSSNSLSKSAPAYIKYSEGHLFASIVLDSDFKSAKVIAPPEPVAPVIPPEFAIVSLKPEVVLIEFESASVRDAEALPNNIAKAISILCLT